MSFKTEIEFVRELEKHFARLNNSIIWLEVPNMGQSVDMVVKMEDKLLLIEAKLKNWDRAIFQCQAHQMVADYIYVAVATLEIPDKLYLRATELGYGILHFDRNTKLVHERLKARKNSYWKPQRDIFEEKLYNPHNYESAALDVI